MNDETKKILDSIKYHIEEEDWFEIEGQFLKPLLDYITNLQQENQELNKENEKWWAIIKDDEQEIKDLCLENSKLEQENERLKEQVKREVEVRDYEVSLKEDYKSRIEKAVEYINNYSVDKSFSFPLMKRWEENQVKSSIDYEFNDTLKKDLLNILNGKE